MAFTKRRATGNRSFRKTYVPKPVKRYVEKKIDATVEDKCTYIRLPDVFNSVGTTWVEQIISDPSQGNGKNQRVGQRIKMKSIEIKGVIAQGSAESGLDDAFNVMRIIVARYSNAQISTFTPLATASQNINDPHTIDFNNANGRLRHKYLDKYIPLQVTSTEKGAGDGYSAGLRSFHYYKRFKKPIYVHWNDNTVNYPSQGLYMCCISDSGAVVNPGFVKGYMLFKFEDA